MIQFVDLKAQHDSLQPALSETILRVIDQSAFIQGTDVGQFEASFAAICGVKHCVSCGNGTDALYIALRALGAGPGDEVITTSHSWISTSETITQTGAQVIFSDTDSFFTIDPDSIEKKITQRTVGVVAVHLYGQPADLDRISSLCERFGLWLIEDCAQAHLATWRGRAVGTFGDAAAFSFYPGKNLGAMGDAGCVVTRRDDIARFAMLFARHGGKGNHEIEGICSRMDTLQAAILNLKLPHLANWNRRRNAAAVRYHSLLSDVPEVVLPTVRDGADHAFHLYVVRARDRDRLRAYLTARGIPTGVHYSRPLPLLAAYARLGHKPEDFPVSSAHAAQVLSLPMHPFLTTEQQCAIASAIREFYSGEV